MLSFALNVIGSLVFITALAWIATLLGASPAYVTTGAGILLAMAIFAAALQRRASPPPAP